MIEARQSTGTQGHLNVALLTEDSTLALRVATSDTTMPWSLDLSRSHEELWHPLVLERFDLLLVDEELARLDTWNIVGRVRNYVGAERPIRIIGAARSPDRFDSDDLVRFGLDAVVERDAEGEQLLASLSALGRELQMRSVAEPSWSRFLPPMRFLESVVEQLEYVGPGHGNAPPEGADVRPPPGSSRSSRHPSASRRNEKPARQPTTRFRMGTHMEALSNETNELVSMPDLTGLTIGKVRIGDEIGSGGGGKVYRGHHVSLDMTVAIKVLYPRLASLNPRFVDRFLHEARLAARLQSGGIIRVLDCERDRETGLYYMVMDHVEGRTLAERIEEIGAITEIEALEVAEQVCACLRAAEALGIVHRDIKPANILFARDGSLRVADLGLARLVEAPAEIDCDRLLDARLPSTTAQIVGTPNYMAPEQIASPNDIDARADMYSLGVTLFHALTGSVPFTADSVSDVLYSHLNVEPPRIEDLRHDISVELRTLIGRLMAKQAHDRFESFAPLHEVVVDLLRQRTSADAGKLAAERLGLLGSGQTEPPAGS